MVGHTRSSAGTVHADVTLTRSKVKVKVTELPKFQKMAKAALDFISALPAARSL